MSKSEHVIDFSRIKASCSNCNMQELCLPRGLNPDDLQRLEHVVKGSRPLHKGEHVFRTNDAFSAFYAIRSGSVKSYMIDDSGEEQVIGFYFPGEILGFDAVDNNMHSCSVVAMETTTYCSLPYNKLNEISQQIPDLQNQLFRLLSREFTKENQMLLSINRRPAEERIATFLVSLSGRFKRMGYSECAFNLPMSRQEIGNYLGLTIETVSRFLSRFQSNGLIDINRKEIRINDLPALHEICDGNRSLPPNKNNSVA
ncbi:MAG: fumarate/nitrate reduction transcriptional regulator Fnr [Gammaproteobacteria bacterium]